MAGVDFPLIGFTTLYLFAVWAIGRAFESCKLPAILGHFLAGVLMGPGFLDAVPYASDGHCETLVMSDTNPAVSSSSSYSSSDSSLRRLASSSFVGVPGDCLGLFVFDGVHIPDIWSFAGRRGAHGR